MAYDLATVTNQGNKLLASVVSDRSSLVIDKIEVSGTKLASSTDLKSMKSISNVVTTLSANGYQKKDNSFIISTVLDNSSVKTDYQAWVFGIWAHEADGGSSALMSVITSTSSPDTISKGSGTPIDYNYKFITTFSNTSSLTIQMASDTYATNDTVIHNSGDETATGTKTFQEIKISNDKFPSLVQTDGQYITLDGGNSEMIPADNSKVIHTTGDETIDGQKKFKTDPTDSAGNAYAKTVDVNQQLDKKVNVADMRKPASDVAGIEEVNAKQDTIGYTPADDSKVAHTAQNSSQQYGLDFNHYVRTGNYRFDNVTTVNYPPTFAHPSYIQLVVFGNDGILSGNAGSVIQIAIQGNKEAVRNMYTGSAWTAWRIVPDDSRVAHLSGANNFDTIPTVNNNPLLLASSLPSDLARTGSNQEFTGKNIFDTAPIDKTTGNPYITKDGVPSDVARTSQQTNFTAGLQSGGVSVATSDDLKSVENSAWHQLSMPDCNGMEGITLLYRNFISDHYINLYAYGNAIQSNINGPTMLDLSSLIDNIESVSGMARGLPVRMSASVFRDSSGEETLVDLVASGNKLTLGTNATIFMAVPVQINGHDSPFAKVTYDNWIGS